MNLEQKYAPLSPKLNHAPESYLSIHLMGICGTGMASLAGMLKDKGFKVMGSDQNVYPPMSDYLNQLNIPVRHGYNPENLHHIPDLVIVGNVITRENPEVQELGRLALPFLSFPQAVKEFAIKDKKSIVVAGTHGKTTTTSLVAWLLANADLEPGFMIGGIPKNFEKSFKLGTGPYFVIEGDEYDTAFFDKGPKFLHYNPWIVVLTSIEFDHADIYRDLMHVMESFKRLVSIIPKDGYLIANGDDKNVMEVANKAKCSKIFYGLGPQNDFRLAESFTNENITRLKIAWPNKSIVPLQTLLYGRHNVYNLLATASLGNALGISKEVLAETAKTYSGVKRRQEVMGSENNIMVIDDFAHHPTSVRETITAIKEKYAKRRLVAVFEPRSNSSRRNIFQELYARSFHAADLVFVPDPPLVEKIPPNQRFSSEKLVLDLKNQGIKAEHAPDTASLLELLISATCPGDVVLFMSNGSFDNLPTRFLERIRNS